MAYNNLLLAYLPQNERPIISENIDEGDFEFCNGIINFFYGFQSVEIKMNGVKYSMPIWK